MREIDRLTTEEFAVPSLLLMEQAASAVARAIGHQFEDEMAKRRVLVLAGPGNNGGDGAAVARVLALGEAKVDVILFGKVDDTKADARVNFDVVRRLASFEAGTAEAAPPVTFVECESISQWEELASRVPHYDIVVDALFGTGLKRPLEGIFSKVVEHVNFVRDNRDKASLRTPLITSIDIPSGLDADSSRLIGSSVKADLTVTFTAPKPGNVLPPACFNNGSLITADIGSPLSLLDKSSSNLFLLEDVDARDWLIKTRHSQGSYKNKHGHVVVVGGSRRMSGAAILCAEAAMRAGCGLATIATSLSAQSIIAARAIPEIMTFPLPETSSGSISEKALEDRGFKDLLQRASVALIGPGLSTNDSARSFVRRLVEERTLPVIIDADGLNALAPWPSSLKGSSDLPITITPHPGEMSRLLAVDKIEDPVESARKLATSQHITIVFKGARALIAVPDGRVFVNPTGNPGTGTAGAGDTLGGIIAGFHAQEFGSFAEKADPTGATIAAVYGAGLAADLAAARIGVRSLVASDIREELSAAIRCLDPEGEQP